MVRIEEMHAMLNDLFELLKRESMNNNSINEFFEYLKSIDFFSNQVSIERIIKLKESIRSINRFSDELYFGEQDYEIRQFIKRLYDLINSMDSKD